LEGEIFDVRSKLGITAGAINTIEQEHVVKNLSGENDRPGVERQERAGETSAVIVFNPLFEENLGGEDYADLSDAQRMESTVAEAVNAFAENYAVIARIASQMPLADTAAQADSLFREYEALKYINSVLTEKIGDDFGFIYDHKLYCYNYILDKLGRRSQISSFERKTAEARERALAAGDSAESSPVAGYPYLKGLLLDYERTLAGEAGYRKSSDSLAGAIASLSNMSFDFPAIHLEEKLFLDYSDITFHSPAKYDSRNPVPEVAVHAKGEIYRILLGSFQRAQPVSILRGAYPVGLLQRDGKYEYYAGGFATIDETARAVEQLKAKGFRDPKIALWSDGKLTVLTPQQADMMLGNLPGGLFRLSVDTADGPLPQIVRQLMEEAAPGAEISRSGSLYIIGPLETRAAAAELMEDILDAAADLEIKIEAVE
ncbi:MAG: hypothetical protein LIO77_06890, partial [Rikenellaceae bacterium]|nr:hypothetical protein [Rikenellaceae bacterium]